LFLIESIDITYASGVQSTADVPHYILACYI